jgi:hypothetical protein
VRRIDDRLLRQLVEPVVQRVIQRGRHRPWVCIRIPQIGTADVADEEHIPGEDHPLPLRFRIERHRVRGVARRLQSLHAKGADQDFFPMLEAVVRILRGDLLRDIDCGAGPLRQLHVARDKVRVRVGLEDGDDLRPTLLSGSDIVIDVAFGIDDGRLPVSAKQIGGVRQPLDKEALDKHLYLPAHPR